MYSSPSMKRPLRISWSRTRPGIVGGTPTDAPWIVSDGLRETLTVGLEGNRPGMSMMRAMRLLLWMRIWAARWAETGGGCGAVMERKRRVVLMKAWIEVFILVLSYFVFVPFLMINLLFLCFWLLFPFLFLLSPRLPLYNPFVAFAFTVEYFFSKYAMTCIVSGNRLRSNHNSSQNLGTCVYSVFTSASSQPE